MQERLNRQERKSQTRERLIDAATDVFARRGFEAATLDEVAAAAGYTKGAVYSNFASKTDLLIALLERRYEVQSAQYSQRFEDQHIDSVARVLLQPVRERTESEKRFLMLLAEFWLHAMRDERTRLLMAEQYEHARTFVSGLLTASGYGQAGREDILEPRDMAIVIEALGLGIALQADLDPEHVRTSLIGEVVGKLLGLPTPEIQAAASAPTATESSARSNPNA